MVEKFTVSQKSKNVFYHPKPIIVWGVEKGPGWYWYDETGDFGDGVPYKNEDDAIKWLEIYCWHLNEGKKSWK